MPGSDTKTQVQSSVSSPWEPTKPMLEGILGKLGGVDTSVTPGQTTANTNFGNLTGMLSDPNNLDPYKTPGFSDAINTMMGDITNKVKSVYAGSGRDPSGAGSFAQSLGRGLTQGISPTIASQFNSNADRSLTAGAANVGSANASFAQPISNIGMLLNPVAGIAGLGGQSSGTGTVTQPQSTFGNILGGAMGTAGILGSLGGSSGGLGALSTLAALSDERAKDNIERVGKLDDGQPVYRYNIKGSPVTEIGLLAQKVAKKVPSAVSDIGAGMLGVDYQRATQRAARRAA